MEELADNNFGGPAHEDEEEKKGHSWNKKKTIFRCPVSRWKLKLKFGHFGYLSAVGRSVGRSVKN